MCFTVEWEMAVLHFDSPRFYPSKFVLYVKQIACDSEVVYLEHGILTFAG